MEQQSNEDVQSFEAMLRQLSPCSEDLSVEETFYQAGWEAACRVNKPARRRQARGFAMGLVSGITCCVAGLLLWPVPERADDRQIVEWTRRPAETGTSDPVQADETEDAAVESGAGGLDEMLALVSPRQWLLVPQDLQRPLSLARGWPEVSSGEFRLGAVWNSAGRPGGQTTAGAGVVSDDGSGEPGESLRAFPLSPEVFDDWL